MLTAALAAFLTQGPATAPQRPTLVRVVDTTGQPLAGARVLFVTAPFTGMEHAEWSVRHEFRTNAKGRVRARVASGRLWCAWAVWDGDGGRLASPVVKDIVPGRPLRLTLREFEAYRVRWLGLTAWRKAAGELGARFFVDLNPTGTADPSPFSARHAVLGSHRGFCGSWFAQAPPADRETEVLLPPLPLHSYYAVLTDAHGGALDVRYMNPAFHLEATNPQVQHLYERGRHLKQLELGKPVSVAVDIVDGRGAKVAGADVSLRPVRSSLQTWRTVQTNGAGRATFLMGFRDSSSFGLYDSKLLVWAPGFEPLYAARPRPKTTQPIVSRFTLRAGARLDWRVAGLAPNDRVVLQTHLAAGRTRILHTLEIRHDRSGKLALPAPVARGARAAFRVFVIRDGRAIPIWLDQGRVPPLRLDRDLGALRDVTFQITAGGKPVRCGGVAQLWATGAKAFAFTRMQIGRDGGARLEFLPGRYAISVRTPMRGDGFTEFTVTEKARTVAIALQPFRLLVGAVRGPDRVAVAGARLQVQAHATAALGSIARALAVAGNGYARVGDLGRFEVYVSGRTSRIALSAQGQVGKSYLSARAEVTSAAPPPILIELGQSSVRRW